MPSRPQNDSSPFLELPGELRNWIYRYALTEPEGLHFKPDQEGNLRLQTADLPNTDANQLRYVNRQLQQETRGLGILYNHLTFATNVQAVLFIWTLSKANLQCLRVLYINDAPRALCSKHNLRLRDSTHDWTLDYFGELFHICRDLPLITVRSSYKVIPLTACIIAAVASTSRCPKRQTLLQRLITDALDRDMFTRMVVKMTSKGELSGLFRNMPSNFRLWLGAFEEDRFRASCADNTDFKIC